MNKTQFLKLPLMTVAVREKNKNFFQTLTKINGRHLYLKDTDEIQVEIHHSLMKCRQGTGGSIIIPGKRDCTWKKA